MDRRQARPDLVQPPGYHLSHELSDGFMPQLHQPPPFLPPLTFFFQAGLCCKRLLCARLCSPPARWAMPVRVHCIPLNVISHPPDSVVPPTPNAISAHSSGCCILFAPHRGAPGTRAAACAADGALQLAARRAVPAGARQRAWAAGLFALPAASAPFCDRRTRTSCDRGCCGGGLQ